MSDIRSRLRNDIPLSADMDLLAEAKKMAHEIAEMEPIVQAAMKWAKAPLWYRSDELENLQVRCMKVLPGN